MSRPLRVICTGLFAAGALAACSNVPELDDQISPALRDADFPTLLPLDTALNATGLPNVTPAAEGKAVQDDLAARAARLRARAAALNSVEN
ncbi:hypothetical protein SAMN04488118_105241 [Epibacterium ulvae]|uniref:Beta-barrel assembly machine subunit BamF n=1 Tax=Epibacterium ulvae TaxID=1156985 RepID=A0A1G5QRP7_9RHOB|nr:hypothetical protein [Epibacterium ulvae]SCZ64437.1 hypothetical protein SAMN04488118_105241 [Epibacterium ulvae]